MTFDRLLSVLNVLIGIVAVHDKAEVLWARWQHHREMQRQRRETEARRFVEHVQAQRLDTQLGRLPEWFDSAVVDDLPGTGRRRA